MLLPSARRGPRGSGGSKGEPCWVPGAAGTDTRALLNLFDIDDDLRPVLYHVIILECSGYPQVVTASSAVLSKFVVDIHLSTALNAYFMKDILLIVCLNVCLVNLNGVIAFIVANLSDNVDTMRQY